MDKLFYSIKILVLFKKMQENFHDLGWALELNIMMNQQYNFGYLFSLFVYL